LRDFQAETEQRNIAWEVGLLPEVWADRPLLRMALVNLFSNAVKFTGARAQARIEIGCPPSGDRETVISFATMAPASTRSMRQGFSECFNDSMTGTNSRAPA